VIRIVKIYQSELINQGNNRFEWLNTDYKKLKSVFCSPGVNISLAFNNGKKLFLRGFEYRDSKRISPNKRTIEVNKDLENEVISGVISKTETTSSNNASIYLVLEK
jgi:hypothetical protein